MLTVIIDARDDAERLPALLAQLTAGAVDGLVRQVLIVADAGQAGIGELCEETGAEPSPTLEAAAQTARADRLLVQPGSGCGTVGSGPSTGISGARARPRWLRACRRAACSAASLMAC